MKIQYKVAVSRPVSPVQFRRGIIERKLSWEGGYIAFIVFFNLCTECKRKKKKKKKRKKLNKLLHKTDTKSCLLIFYYSRNFRDRDRDPKEERKFSEKYTYY